MESLKKQQLKLPKSPGVYFFKNKKGRILYIGKATLLRTRIAAYLKDDVDIKTKLLIENATKIDFQQTDTALEALFLEAELIKKHQPFYNIRQKDDKSNAYLVITDEQFPRIEIARPTTLIKHKIKKSYGPFRSKKELEQALKILRRIFPYHSDKNMNRPCFYHQIGLCPGPCAGAITAKDYRKNIKNLSIIFEGGKKRIVAKLKKQMQKHSKTEQYEKAAGIRDTLLALENHRDIEAGKDSFNWKVIEDVPKRLEAYDISNISGKYATGSMVVFTYGRADKTQYRKFKIRNFNDPNDPGMIKEIIARRLNNDWERPSVIFIDGGLGQLRAVTEVLKARNLKIPVVSAAKGADRKAFRVFSTNKKLKINRDLLKQAAQEAHRFAIGYHRKLRERGFLKK
ncbi:MAG: hypothetical protein GF332_02460 [Candidatus Moranbacteria bacterium]|nr:hypothetical protein [Candidatus Moranbacteria bacterium]